MARRSHDLRVVILSFTLTGIVACSRTTSTSPASTSGEALTVNTQRNGNARTGEFFDPFLDQSKLIYGLELVGTLNVTGQVYAQPLTVDGVATSLGPMNLVFAVTDENKLYAYNTKEPPELVWGPVSFGTPIPKNYYGATDHPHPAFKLGILSTPVIDGNTLYLVAHSVESGSAHITLHAVDIRNGDKLRHVEIAGSSPGAGGTTITFNPKFQVQRSGLLFLDGVVYIAFGAQGWDRPPYHGWFFAYDTTGVALTKLATYCDSCSTATPTGDATERSGGGIWQAGSAPAADPSGNIYLMTGNGFVPTGTDLHNSFVKLSTATVRLGSLSVSSFFKPHNSESMDCADLDLGSAGPVYIPGTSLLLGGGKTGRLYLLNTASLGGSNPDYYATRCSDGTVCGSGCPGGKPITTTGTDSVLDSRQVSSNEILATPVYWRAKSWAFVRLNNDELYRVTVDKTAKTLPAVSKTTGMTAPAGQMSLSINTVTKKGILWITEATDSTGNGQLSAIDGETLDLLWSQDLGKYIRFNPPTISNGRVYIGTQENGIRIIGPRTKVLFPPIVLYTPCWPFPCGGCPPPFDFFSFISLVDGDPPMAWAVPTLEGPSFAPQEITNSFSPSALSSLSRGGIKIVATPELPEQMQPGSPAALVVNVADNSVPAILTANWQSAQTDVLPNFAGSAPFPSIAAQGSDLFFWVSAQTGIILARYWSPVSSQGEVYFLNLSSGNWELGSGGPLAAIPESSAVHGMVASRQIPGTFYVLDDVSSELGPVVRLIRTDGVNVAVLGQWLSSASGCLDYSLSAAFGQDDTLLLSVSGRSAIRGGAPRHAFSLIRINPSGVQEILINQGDSEAVAVKAPPTPQQSVVWASKGADDILVPRSTNAFAPGQLQDVGLCQ